MNKFNNFDPQLIVKSPGRINFMGGHTCYNNGFVLPAAINKNITLGFKTNNTENICNFFIANFDKFLAVNLKKISLSTENWENYILGVLIQLLKKSKNVRGFDCFITCELPICSSFSAAAALECGLAYGINELFNLGISKKEIALLCSDAEREIVGNNYGIMDQYASVFGQKNNVLIIDCEYLEYLLLPMNLTEYSVLILNTKVDQTLTTSQHNTRRAQCEKGVAIIKEKFSSVNSLRDVTLEMLEECKKMLQPVLYKRCRYVIEENMRVMKSVDYLKANQLKEFGALLYECHDGLRHQYEVTCPELDFLIDFSKDKEYVVGSRMMEDGFGGCTVSIIHNEFVDHYIKLVSDAYETQFNIKLDAFQVAPSTGTNHELVTINA